MKIEVKSPYLINRLKLMAEYFDVDESEMVNRCIDFRYSCLKVLEEFEEFIRDYYDSPVGISNQ